ncbi:UNVERIFIED_CONTAM: hypothetical protein HDU68_009788 [Siphonaria sp. JEL0065]|nr:hypothetical protein HDU68_009788 [Siphonaria sp. JEL0065]
MAELARGFLAFQSFSTAPVTPWIDIFYKHFIELTKFDNDTLIAQGLDSAMNTINWWPVSSIFDCTMMLILGFDKLLRENPQFTPEQLSSRSLSKYLNFSQFLDLGYDGLAAQPVVMNSRGDLMMPYMASSYNGTVNKGVTNSNQNPFFMNTFAFTDLRATNITYYQGAQPMFFDGSNTPPPDGPPKIIITPSVNDLNSSNGKGIVALVFVGLLFSVATGTFFIKFQNLKAVKMASVPECLVIVFGSMLSYISLGFYVGNVTKTACKARIWLVLMGYVCMMIPVIMKNVRLFIILKSKKRLDAAMLTFINRIVIALGVFIELALLVYWTISAKTAPVQIVADGFSFYICESTDVGGVSVKLLSTFTTIIHFLLMVLAYMLKDVDPIYNESAALATIFALVGIIVALLQILPSNPTYSLDFTESICIWVATTLTLVLLFLKKMHEVLFESLIEKGILKLQLQSSFLGVGTSSQTGTGTKSAIMASPVRAGSPTKKTGESSDNVSNQSSSSLGQEASQTESQEMSMNSNKPLVKKRSVKQNRSQIGAIRKTHQTTSAMAELPKDNKKARRPCHCQSFTGIKIFKFKLKKYQPLWNVWNGGVLYFNNVRKRTWISIATLDKVYTFTIMSTSKIERIGNFNQVSISNFPGFKYHLIVELKDDEATKAFITEVIAVKSQMLAHA